MNKFIVSLCVVALCGVASSHPSDDGDVLVDSYNMKIFTMPESCKSKGKEFCFDNADYPIEIVEDLLKDNANLEVEQDDELGTGFVNRQGSDDNDCRSRATTDPIYYIVDESGNDRVVVQMEGRFQQRFSVMWCDKEGPLTTKTQHFLKATVKNYKMYCENKYMKYDFLVLSSTPDLDGKYKLERARTKSGVPVCCACKYEKL